MGSSGKRKTTFAKLARESKLRERRLEKQAKKEARRQRAAENRLAGIDDENLPTQVGDDQPADIDDENQPTEIGDPPAEEER
jgi:hypothetical protein